MTRAIADEAPHEIQKRIASEDQRKAEPLEEDDHSRGDPPGQNSGTAEVYPTSQRDGGLEFLSSKIEVGLR